MGYYLLVNNTDIKIINNYFKLNIGIYFIKRIIQRFYFVLEKKNLNQKIIFFYKMKIVLSKYNIYILDDPFNTEHVILSFFQSIV